MPLSSPGLRRRLLAVVASALLVAPASARAEGKRVAVVIGVGSHAKLDADLALPGATGTAAQLSLALDQHGGYDQVLPLIDAVATRTAIEDLLLRTLPPQLGAEDTLLVYFVGHGVGGDFGEPYLLPYDVDPDDVQATAISVESLSSSLRNALPVGNLVVVTDAVHDMRMGDLVLMGPNAKSWPDITEEFFSLSACSPKQMPKDTPFGQLVTDGLSGAADTSGDGTVSANELHRFVLDHMGEAKAHPAESGSYNPELVVARVTQGPQDFAAYAEPEHNARPRRIAGLAIAGVGLGVLGGGLAFYFDGISIQSQVRDDEQIEARYRRDLQWSKIMYGASAVPLVAGGTLMVWPSPSGAAIGWSTTF